jgi:mono/diheme cytochrome c family protein
MLDDKQNITWAMYVSVVVLFTALLPDQATAAQDVSALRNLDAKQLYQKLCSVCHGDKGDGDSRAAGSFNPRPRNFTATESAIELSRERMIHSVTFGRPGTAMVGHAKKLSPQQIESLVDYIRSTFMHLPAGASKSALPGKMDDLLVPNVIPEASPNAGMQPSLPSAGAMGANAVTADMTLPLPQKLKGHVESGRAFFMKNCFTCHGVKGDGNGPRAYFIAPRPRNFTSEESRKTYNRPRLFDAISNGKRGTVMPAWGKVLNEQQVANVAEFVFQAYIKGSYKLNLPETLLEDDKKKGY